MAADWTLAIIKPDAMEARRAGRIIARIEEEGFSIRGMRQVQLTRAQAEGFYEVHRERPFFDELCTFMSRSPIVVMALQASGAVDKWRRVIGATDPKKAERGTIREQHGSNVGENAVHGSDADDTAAREIAYFFPGYEIRS
jgi:nucleoside-diphosphate kinase